MPLYGFRCPDQHLTTEVRVVDKKHGARCTCGKRAEYSYADSIGGRCADGRSGDLTFLSREREDWYKQTGIHFDRVRDFDTWCKKNGKEVIRGCDVGIAQKRRAERVAALRESERREAERIWSEETSK